MQFLCFFSLPLGFLNGPVPAAIPSALWRSAGFSYCSLVRGGCWGEPGEERSGVKEILFFPYSLQGSAVDALAANCRRLNGACHFLR